GVGGRPARALLPAGEEGRGRERRGAGGGRLRVLMGGRPGDDRVAVEAAGRSVEISHPDKVFFPGSGHTKLDLASYYLAVAEPLMATMGGRPVLLQRFPHGA